VDDATWRAAWAEGRTTPPEELVARILEGQALDGPVGQ